MLLSDEYWPFRLCVALCRGECKWSTISLKKAGFSPRFNVNTTNKYLAMDLEAKREALAKAKPLLEGGRRSGKWHHDLNLIAWLEQL